MLSAATLRAVLDSIALRFGVLRRTSGLHPVNLVVVFTKD